MGYLSWPLLLVWFFLSSIGAFTPVSRRRSQLLSPSKQNHLYSTPNDRLDKGFNLLEIASSIVPQGQVVQTVKETWKFGWKRMMAELAPQDPKGRYQRPSYPFKGVIGRPPFPDEAGRYHVFVGNPCPWCHRVRLVVNMLGIQECVGVTQLVDDPVKASRGGWVFSSKDPDPIFGSTDLRELYDRLSPGYQGRCTAPLLVDKVAKSIVSNESSDIVRMLNAAEWDGGKKTALDLYPPDLASSIDSTNDWVYTLLNNGVYRCGFATTQDAYKEASADVREGLRRCDEEILAQNNFLCGDQFTEADLRLLPTILRYDGAYAALFKAGGTHLRIRDYPNLYAWLQRCWALSGVRESIDLADANQSYFKQLFPLNPGGIIPDPPVSEADLGLA